MKSSEPIMCPYLKVFAFICLQILAPTISQSQTRSHAVSGIIFDSDSKTALEFASVKMINKQDTLVIKSTMSDLSGKFTLSVPKAGEYLLKITYVGYNTSITQVLIKETDSLLNFGEIIMHRGIDLKEVAVQGESLAIRVKKDTVEYNAGSYRTVPNAPTEDLLRKLPGVEVEKNGNIKADGVNVSKVTVDGKDFFDRNTKAATLNIPADAVSKVQVIDDKTERDKISGIDQGDREKVINLVLKEKNVRWFGGGALAGGTSKRFLGSASINRFDKKKQISFISGSNNVNQGFSSDDGANFLGGANSGNLPGVNQTHAGGVNYSDTWGRKNGMKINSSYIGSFNSSNSDIFNHIQNTQSNDVFFNESNSLSTNRKEQHRANFKLTTKIDSSTTLILSSSLSISNNFNKTNQEVAQRNSKLQMITKGRSIFEVSGSTPSLNGEFSISRQLRDKKGVVSLIVANGYNTLNTDNINSTENIFHQNTQTQTFNRLENQYRINRTFSVFSSLSYAISRDKKTAATITSFINSGKQNNNRYTTEFNPATSAYETVIDSLTNDLGSYVNSYFVNLGLTKAAEKWNLNVQNGIRYTVVNGETLSTQGRVNLSRNVVNMLLPTIYFQLRPKTNISYTFTSSIRSEVPQVADLVEVQYNTNPLNVRIGNPSLKPSNTFYANFTYLKSNAAKNYFFRLGTGLFIYDNYLGYSRHFDKTLGIMSTQPINVKGNYDFSVSPQITIPTKVTGLKVSSALWIGSTRYGSLLNGQENQTTTLNAGGSINVSYAFKESFNVTFNNQITRIELVNSSYKQMDSNYFNLSNAVIISFEPIKGWRINTDFSRQAFAGQSVAVFNFGLQKFFTIQRKLSLELRGFDILKNNFDISRSVNSNLITDTRSNSIQKYFYLKMNYRIAK